LRTLEQIIEKFPPKYASDIVLGSDDWYFDGSERGSFGEVVNLYDPAHSFARFLRRAAAQVAEWDAIVARLES